MRDYMSVGIELPLSGYQARPVSYWMIAHQAFLELVGSSYGGHIHPKCV